MQNRQFLKVYLVLLMAVTGLSPALAEEFFYWVDENGVANFSQWAPQEPVDNLVREPLPATQQPPYNPQEDLYAVQATQESIQALREEMQQRREEARQQRQSNQPTVIYQPVETNSYPYWYPGFRPRPPRPWPPGGHPGPEPQPDISVPFRPPGR